MIQHQADSSEQPQDPPTSATTRSESQRSSLEIIAEALNRQQQRRGRRHLSPQPILTPLSTSSVGEMHQSQRSNDNNHDRGEATTKEKEERQQPATLFFSISFFLFISHLARPLSESAGSTREKVGATSSSSSNLSDIKQRLINSIEILLDSDNKLNTDLNNKERQQDSNMSSADQPSTTSQTATQASVEPTMVPSSAGTSATSILPRLNPITINESTIMRQLNSVTINMLYQTASPTLLNLYDNFSAVVFSANSTPVNLSDNVPILKHASDFINNMKPAQRSTTTTATTEWYICLTEEEHQYYQLNQHLMTRPFNHHQQQ